VEAFAQERDLRYELEYQNAPVWLVWQEVRPDNDVRVVQVAAFRMRDGEALFFIPHAYRFEDEKLRTTPPVPTNVVQRPLQAFYANLDVEIVRQEIHKLRGQAWAGAEALRKSNVIHLS
jgi:hypothetical protein